ncbi:hypothetical protein TOPH_08253 [Tolypocladium ophioglossoides CBS 100239]|uniref:Isoamyl alcohol oxidase n=1 Tax=Tolypocladium ophioglossoides (strain CBS 100239) TaxID=1163406 RepID=A0A0L0MZ23_TOLOC|nr:hypothetical protein TOPH_08253 [Tolypocladium ophioglossoides CBS 100239]
MLLSCLVFFAAAAGVVHSQACPAHARTKPVADNTAITTDEGQHDTVLSPVLNPKADPTNLQNIVPSTNVSLNWGSQSSGLVHVSLEMNHPTVLLEEIGAIAAVDCEAASVTITFSRADAFHEAVAGWSADDGFVLVTNHLGNCDADKERGVFLAQGITSDSNTLTVVALGEKTDIKSTAGLTEISFSSIPVHSKRATNLDVNGLTLAHSLSLPHATKLYSYHHDPNVDVHVTADSAALSMGATFSGKLRYSIFKAKLHEMSFDIDAHASVDLVLTTSLTTEFNTTFTYGAPPLTYSIVKVPGIVSLGPALDIAIGVYLAADAGVSVTTNLGAEIANGNFHLDFLDQSRSSATGWKPTFHAAANISEHAAVAIDPYVDITAKLDFQLLGGLVDLSGGMTARPRFNNDFTLNGNQHVNDVNDVNNLNGTWHRQDKGRTHAVARSQGEFAGCAQGLGIKSGFEFSVIAFVTQWWKKTIYSVDVPIADKCYSWA